MDLHAYWETIDPLINVALAIDLATLTFAGAAFLTRWAEVKGAALAPLASNPAALQAAALKAKHAHAAVRYLLLAFAAFALLLAQGVLVDPLQEVAGQWNAGADLDSISAGGSLAAGLVLFLRAAIEVYWSLDTPKPS